MNVNDLLDEYSPEEARGAGELKFLEWLFLLQQLMAVVIIISVFVAPIMPKNMAAFLDVVTHNAPLPVLGILLATHIGIILLIFFFKKPLGFTLLIGWVAAMALYSVAEFFLRPVAIYQLVGLALMVFWGIYFFRSPRIRIRFFYAEAFARASRTITCPHCKQDVLIDAENCGDAITDAERFDALCARIRDVKLSQDIRVAQIVLLDSRFGQKALGFLKEEYNKQLASPSPVAKIASALARIIAKYPEERPKQTKSSKTKK